MLPQIPVSPNKCSYIKVYEFTLVNLAYTDTEEHANFTINWSLPGLALSPQVSVPPCKFSGKYISLFYLI